MIGEHTAPDNWLIVWNTDIKPGHITVYNAKGVRQLVTSGQIDDGLVHRRLVEFKREHSGQLRMVI